MTEIIVPLKFAISDGEHYGIKFDPDKITGCNVRREAVIAPSEGPFIKRIPGSEVQLTLNFEGAENFPQWVELCDRCLESEGTENVREICKTCDDVKLCNNCFVLHNHEVVEEAKDARDTT